MTVTAKRGAGLLGEQPENGRDRLRIQIAVDDPVVVPSFEHRSRARRESGSRTLRGEHIFG